MRTYLVRRLLQAVPILVGVTVVTFALIHLAPGDPYAALIDPQIDPADLAVARAALGLDQPPHVQYARWLRELARGNLGRSIRHKQPVSEMIGERIGATALLAFAAQLIIVAVGVPGGVVSATRRGSGADALATLTAFAAVSMPSFFLALLAMRVFSLGLGWFPSAGMVTPGAGFTGFDHLRDVAAHLAMPAVVLASTGVHSVAAMLHYTRSSVLEALRQEYVRTARSKGLPERVVIYRHALRNALIPVITLLGLGLPSLMSGAVITETVFAWPGVGRMNFTAIAERDYPVLMGVNLLFAGMIIAGNLVADIGYALADPRIRYA